MPLAGWPVFTTASSANLADGLHLTFTLTKKVSKLIPRRELTYSPILVCFHLAIYRLVKGLVLRFCVFGAMQKLKIVPAAFQPITGLLRTTAYLISIFPCLKPNLRVYHFPSKQHIYINNKRLMKKFNNSCCKI